MRSTTDARSAATAVIDANRARLDGYRDRLAGAGGGGKLMPMRKLALLIAVLALSSLTGCVTNVPAVSNPVATPGRDYDRIYRAAIEELRDRGFHVDRQDYRFGRVSAKPVRAPFVLEFWRPHHTTAEQVGTATINHERRLITVDLKPIDDPIYDPTLTDPDLEARRSPEYTRYELHVEVMIERLQNPRQRLNGSTAGTRIRSDLREVPLELRERGITSAYWQPIKRDPYLERRLLDAILDRAAAMHEAEQDAANEQAS